MGLVTVKLQETAAHVIAMSVLVLNLRKIQCALLQVLTALLDTWVLQRKLAFVQWTLSIDRIEKTGILLTWNIVDIYRFLK